MKYDEDGVLKNILSEKPSVSALSELDESERVINRKDRAQFSDNVVDIAKYEEENQRLKVSIYIIYIYIYIK